MYSRMYIGKDRKMNYTQKSALYGLYLAGFLLLIPLVDLIDTKIPFYIWQPIGIIGSILFIIPLYRLNKSKDKTFDELDKKICIRAGIFAIVLLCAIGIVVYTTAIFAYDSFSLSQDNLTIAVYSGNIIFISSLSVAVLVQYHYLNRSERAEK